MKTGHAWTRSRLHVGNRWKNPRDLDNHGSSRRLRDPGRRREKTDRTCYVRGCQPTTLSTDVLCSHYGVLTGQFGPSRARS